jgi:hypothetical protein
MLKDELLIGNDDRFNLPVRGDPPSLELPLQINERALAKLRSGLFSPPPKELAAAEMMQLLPRVGRPTWLSACKRRIDSSLRFNTRYTKSMVANAFSMDLFNIAGLHHRRDQWREPDRYVTEEFLPPVPSGT